MCNSYYNGLCLYYGVKVSELNNKCDRGDCMTITVKCKCGNERTVEVKDVWDKISNENEKIKIYSDYDGVRMSCECGEYDSV